MHVRLQEELISTEDMEMALNEEIDNMETEAKRIEEELDGLEKNIGSDDLRQVQIIGAARIDLFIYSRNWKRKNELWKTKLQHFQMKCVS